MQLNVAKQITEAPNMIVNAWYRVGKKPQEASLLNKKSFSNCATVIRLPLWLS